MQDSWLAAILGWFLPGVGHIKQGYYVRGAVIATVVWLFFIIGMMSGGVYFPGMTFDQGALLYLLHIFASMGNGLGYVINFFLAANPPADAAAVATFEYGGKFIEAAGLINFLAALDIFDITVKRKA
jgi:hypothetical protein